MKSTLHLLAFIAIIGSSRAADPPEIRLWPKGMPEPVVPATPAEKVDRGPDGISRRSNVSQPRLFVYQPPAGTKVTGAGVVVVPGGGFGRLADEHEGNEACVWVAKHGIVAFQLAYRTPTNKHTEPHAGPVQDVQKAILEVRRRADAYRLDPKKIGILGFSAGGQLALIALSNELRFLSEKMPWSHKPDFLLAIYPYRIYDPDTKALRPDIRLDGGLPPTFVAQMTDDTSSLPQGSTLLYLELVKRKIPAELHLYERGGHGFGMRARPGAPGTTDWQVRALAWLRLRDYANP